MSEHQRRMIKECVAIVSQDYPEENIQPSKPYYLVPVDDGAEWKVYLRCGTCDSQIVPGVKISTIPPTTHEEVMTQLRQYIDWHISQKHGKSDQAH